MSSNKTRHFVVCGSAILMGFVAAAILVPASVARAQGGHDSAASTATFRTKCAMCHGPDGAGSEVGKSLNVPDLRSAVVQKLPDAELAEIISNGKAGMPSFKSSLSADEIHALVTHIRALGRKK
jgi:cytochrome c6